MAGGRGGRRPGAGRKPSGAARRREWLRSLIDDPERQELFRKALDKELREGKTTSFFQAFAQACGNPPQALDVRTSEVAPGEQLIYRAAFDDGASVFAETEDVSAEPTE